MTQPTTCSHTWSVSAFTVTLTVDFTPGAPPARNVWHPVPARLLHARHGSRVPGRAARRDRQDPGSAR